MPGDVARVDAPVDGNAEWLREQCAVVASDKGLVVNAPEGVESEQFSPETPRVIAADYMLALNFEGNNSDQFRQQPSAEALAGEFASPRPRRPWRTRPTTRRP